MRLGLALKSAGKSTPGGVGRIGMKNLAVVNIDTMEELTDKTGLLWGDRSILLSSDNSLLTPEHFGDDPEDASYLIIVVRCDEAINL